MRAKQKMPDGRPKKFQYTSTTIHILFFIFSFLARDNIRPEKRVSELVEQTLAIHLGGARAISTPAPAPLYRSYPITCPTKHFRDVGKCTAQDHANRQCETGLNTLPMVYIFTTVLFMALFDRGRSTPRRIHYFPRGGPARQAADANYSGNAGSSKCFYNGFQASPLRARPPGGDFLQVPLGENSPSNLFSAKFQNRSLLSGMSI